MLVGLLTAVLVAGIGIVLLGFPTRSWTASASLIVLPNPTASPTDAAGLYDQLSNQVVATFASVVQSADATAAAPLAGPTRVVVTPVAETTLISVTATAPDPQAAVGLADQVATTGVRTLTALRTPFSTAVLSPAGPTLALTPTADPALVIGVIAVVALVAGAAAHQGVRLATRSATRWRAGQGGDGDAQRPETVEEPGRAYPRPGENGSPRPAPTVRRYVPFRAPAGVEPDPPTTEFSLVDSAAAEVEPAPSADADDARTASSDGPDDTPDVETPAPDDEAPVAEEPSGGDDGREADDEDDGTDDASTAEERLGATPAPRSPESNVPTG